jgi:hypothetical protein
MARSRPTTRSKVKIRFRAYFEMLDHACAVRDDAGYEYLGLGPLTSSQTRQLARMTSLRHSSLPLSFPVHITRLLGAVCRIWRIP